MIQGDGGEKKKKVHRGLQMLPVSDNAGEGGGSALTSPGRKKREKGSTSSRICPDC